MPKQKFAKLPVCKPCWELNYCPYGIIVETMPLMGDGSGFKERKHIIGETWDEMYSRSLQFLRDSVVSGNDRKIWEGMFFVLYADQNKWEAVKDYNPEDVSCSYFGHVCPVFFYRYENVTETRELRRSKRYIPRDVMFKVARRDDFRCQKCGNFVQDADMQFDHIIPHVKGGPTTVGNLRLLCGKCNRKKSDSLKELLDADR